MPVDASEAIREVARRFCLPCALVREARQAFDYYCALDDKSNAFIDASTAASDCAGAASTTQGSANNNAAAPAGAPLLGVEGLRAYYADIGLSFSAVEVAELVTGLLAEPAEVQLFRAQEAAQRLQQSTGDEMARGAGLSASIGGTQDGHVTASQMPAKTTSRGAVKSSGTHSVVADECGQKECAVVTPTAAAVVTATDASMTHERKASQGLPFALFLHLMLHQEEQLDLAGRHGAGRDLADRTNLPGGDEESRAEMRAMFRALDHDGDGVLSAEDVCHDVKYLMELDEGNLARDREVLRLACMRPDELHAALRECDGDGDGLVTLADLICEPLNTARAASRCCMGVPLLLTWLRKRFASCFLPAPHDEAACMAADNVYIDLNSLLYQSAMIVGLRRGHFVSTEEVEEAVLRKLYDLLDDILFRLVQPGALVYIAVDGVSPLGKMAQQRARRRRHGGRRVHAAAGAAAMAELPAGSRADNMDAWWDSNCISVGTCFMAKVTGALHAYAVSRSERVNRKRFDDAAAVVTKADSERNDTSSSASTVPAVAFTPLAIVIDDVLRPGEGENKIAEVIRRFRAQPEYRRGTSHVICSSDTDVTVSSLLLHEPNMHILRYEPPPEVGGRAAWQPQSPLRPPAPLGDSWLSTFFSVALFRARLRALLGFGDAASVTTTARMTQDAVRDDNFERSLHDVVFVLLLFGNDFLPTVGGSIQEGTLDALLSLLATDFVSRGRTIVTAETNDIHVPSARYLLDCLDELRSATGGGGGLQIYDGGGGSSNDKQRGSSSSTAGGADGETGLVRLREFEQDAQFQLRRAQQERRLETKCYCYWTMLQWAMQYSAGVVDHWGCYYPYSDAPPLSALRRYCGVLSYEALIHLAAARHKERHGSDHSSTAVPPQETAEAEAVALATEVRRPAEGADRGRPTDAMVQLLVLLPARSTALLPAVLREHYDEIAEAVQAPVELLDIDGIERWCAAQLPRLSEAERTRFTAYRVFAQRRSLAAHMAAAAAEGDAAVCPATTTTGVSCDATHRASGATREMLTQMCVGDVTFIAYWPAEMCRAELQRLLAQNTAKPRDTTDGGCTVKAVTARAGVGDVGLFFQSRPSKTVTSTLTELLVRPCRAATVTAPVAATPCTTPRDEESAPPERPCVSISADRLIVCGDADEGNRSECSSYVFLVASCEALRDTALIAAMGTINGSHFTTTMYTDVTQHERRNTLSGSSTGGRVRMRWRLAVAPDAGRDVWRSGAPPVQLKRARSPAPPPSQPIDAVDDKRAEVRRRLRALQDALGRKATPE